MNPINLIDVGFILCTSPELHMVWNSELSYSYTGYHTWQQPLTCSRDEKIWIHSFTKGLSAKVINSTWIRIRYNYITYQQGILILFSSVSCICGFDGIWTIKYPTLWKKCLGIDTRNVKEYGHNVLAVFGNKQYVYIWEN